MQTIAHRELRNSSSSILARTQAGESFVITNHGVAVAILTPPTAPATELDRLRAAGKTKPAIAPRRKIASIPRTPRLSSGELLDDIRGNW